MDLTKIPCLLDSLKGGGRGEGRNTSEEFDIRTSELVYISIEKTLSLLSLAFPLLLNIHHFFAIEQSPRNPLQPIATNLFNNEMHFNLAVGVVLSTASAWTTCGAAVGTNNFNMVSALGNSFEAVDGPLAALTHVVCQAGLSDTKICEQTFCACAGTTYFLQTRYYMFEHVCVCCLGVFLRGIRVDLVLNTNFHYNMMATYVFPYSFFTNFLGLFKHSSMESAALVAVRE